MNLSEWKILQNDDDMFYIGIPVACACCGKLMDSYRPHTSGHLFDEWEDAVDYLDALREDYEAREDAYYEEFHDEIAAQERYEDYHNEY